MVLSLSRTVRPLVVVCALCAAVWAQEADQVNDPSTTDVVASCAGTFPGDTDTIQQSFTPGASTLVAVDIRLQGGSSFEGLSAGAIGTLLYITNDDFQTTTPFNPSDSNILAAAQVDIDSDAFDNGSALIRWEFSLSVTPGETYRIVWRTPETSIIGGWLGASGNPYSGGNAYGCTGSAWPNSTDFNFITYGASDSGGSCREMLEDLLSDVEDLELNCRKKYGCGWYGYYGCSTKPLTHPLKAAIYFLGNDKPFYALQALGAFKQNVLYFAYVGKISWSDAKELLGRAWEIKVCIIKSLNFSKRRHRYCGGKNGEV